MSQIRDSATATITPIGMAQQLSKWIYLHNRKNLLSSMENASMCTGALKRCPAALLTQR